MDNTNLLAAVLLLVFVVAAAAADASNAHRILIGEPQNDNTTLPVKDSPVASPPPPPPTPIPAVGSPSGNGSEPNPVVDDPSKNKTKAAPPAKTPVVDLGTKGLNNDTKSGEVKAPETKKKENNPAPETSKNGTALVSTPPGGGEEKSKEVPPDGGKDNGKGAEKKKKKDDNVTDPPNVIEETCDGVIKTCKVKDVVVACIKSFDGGSKKAAVLVQNIGDSILKGTLSAENIVPLEILKHKNEKVNISVDIDKSTMITLKSGNEVCELHMDPPVLDGNFFLRLPSYKYLVTPINGAYFLIVTVVIFGGGWACCLVRKKKQRTGGGVPYQELEMGLPESVSATAVETAEGWDEGWDDDWDGDNAVKSPGAHLVGSISSNGLTSRSGNKDGWENDWDD